MVFGGGVVVDEHIPFVHLDAEDEICLGEFEIFHPFFIVHADALGGAEIIDHRFGEAGGPKLHKLNCIGREGFVYHFAGEHHGVAEVQGDIPAGFGGCLGKRNPVELLALGIFIEIPLILQIDRAAHHQGAVGIHRAVTEARGAILDAFNGPGNEFPGIKGFRATEIVDQIGGCGDGIDLDRMDAVGQRPGIHHVGGALIIGVKRIAVQSFGRNGFDEVGKGVPIPVALFPKGVGVGEVKFFGQRFVVP